MIGKIYWSVFPFYDCRNQRNSFKKRPVLIIGGPRNNDYTVLPVSSVSKRQYLDGDYDLELDPQKFPMLGLSKVCYLRTHKQTIVNQSALTTEICDFKSVCPDLYLQAMVLVEKFEKMLIDGLI